MTTPLFPADISAPLLKLRRRVCVGRESFLEGSGGANMSTEMSCTRQLRQATMHVVCIHHHLLPVGLSSRQTCVASARKHS